MKGRFVGEMLLLLCVWPGHSNTLQHFGYYYGMTPFDQLSMFANHSNTAFIGDGGPDSNRTAETVSQLKELRRLNMTGVLPTMGAFMQNATALRDDWQENWNRYWEALSPYTDAIQAFYPADEPHDPLISSGVYGTMVRAIRKSAPAIPIAAVVTPSSVKGIEFGEYSLPPEVNWIGFDHYGCWAADECAHGHCCWENRTVPHNLEVIKSYVTKRGGKMLVVPDGVAGGGKGQKPQLPSEADQQMRASRDSKYFEFCEAE